MLILFPPLNLGCLRERKRESNRVRRGDEGEQREKLRGCFIREPFEQQFSFHFQGNLS
jgi:hypothetical protein